MEKRRKRRNRRKSIGIIIVLIAVVVAVCALWLIASGMGSDKAEPVNTADGSGEEAPIADSGPEDIAGPAEPAVTGEGDPVVEDDPHNGIWFYDESRTDRYDAFAAENPVLPFEDVVWKVNVDLDQTPYEDISEAVNYDSITVLVNKFFHLPRDYSPDNLVYIGNSMMRAEAADAMNEMIDAAASYDHHLWVQSGYRSYSTQAGLFEQYTARDGVDKAETYSARPGHSEHQTGLVGDLNTISDAFGDTPEGKWVADNSWMFGFIVRYTAENTDITLYKPEPWHMRYIGKEDAEKMHDLGILSYEEYWAKYVSLR